MASSTRPSSRWTETTAPHIVALRGKPADIPRPFESSGRAMTISLETKILFQELLPRLRSIEFVGPVERIRSDFVNGIKRMPVKLQTD